MVREPHSSVSNHKVHYTKCFTRGIFVKAFSRILFSQILGDLERTTLLCLWAAIPATGLTEKCMAVPKDPPSSSPTPWICHRNCDTISPSTNAAKGFSDELAFLPCFIRSGSTRLQLAWPTKQQYRYEYPHFDISISSEINFWKEYPALEVNNAKLRPTTNLRSRKIIIRQTTFLENLAWIPVPRKTPRADGIRFIQSCSICH